MIDNQNDKRSTIPLNI